MAVAKQQLAACLPSAEEHTQDAPGLRISEVSFVSDESGVLSVRAVMANVGPRDFMSYPAILLSVDSGNAQVTSQAG
jgi:hypothetical protein